MFPYFSIFGHTIPAYSLLSLTGVLLALLYYLRARRHSAFPEADGELVIIYGVAGAFFGAKLLFLATVLPEFLRDFHFLFSETEIFLETYLYSGFVSMADFTACSWLHGSTAGMPVWISANVSGFSFR